MTRPHAAPTVVPVWTGAEVRFLRLAKRMSVQDFAEYVGVSKRMVSRWEAGGADAVPRPFNQQSLDICLQRCGPDERARFLAQVQALTGIGAAGRCLGIVQRCLQRQDMREALAARDIAAVFRILNAHGISQREVAAMTGQSQSEVSEILGGRKVVAYDVHARVAEGLGVPRGHMGLDYDEDTRALVGLAPRRPRS